MKESIKELDRMLRRVRFIALSFLPMMTIQVLVVYSVPNPLNIGCALLVFDIGIEVLIEQYKAEKYHAKFLSDLPKEWLP